jgi:hypothetical protein
MSVRTAKTSHTSVKEKNVVSDAKKEGAVSEGAASSARRDLRFGWWVLLLFM